VKQMAAAVAMAAIDQAKLAAVRVQAVGEASQSGQYNAALSQAEVAATTCVTECAKVANRGTCSAVTADALDHAEAAAFSKLGKQPVQQPVVPKLNLQGPTAGDTAVPHTAVPHTRLQVRLDGSVDFSINWSAGATSATQTPPAAPQPPQQSAKSAEPSYDAAVAEAVAIATKILASNTPRGTPSGGSSVGLLSPACPEQLSFPSPVKTAKGGSETMSFYTQSSQGFMSSPLKTSDEWVVVSDCDSNSTDGGFVSIRSTEGL